MSSTLSYDNDFGQDSSGPSASPEKQWLNLLCRLAGLGLNLTNDENVLDLTPFITLGEFVGGGGCAEVYKTKWNETPTLLKDVMVSLPELAIKIVRVPMTGNQNQRSKGLKQLKREMAVWRTLQHKNILKLIGVAYLGQDPEEPALVSLFMSCGNLKEYLQANPSADKLFLALSIAEGLSYLHSHNPEVIHGDLKALNILIDSRGNPYLADFGLSRMIQHATLWQTSAHQVLGTLRWMAPEFLSQTQVTVSKPGDVYAYAMVFYEIMTGHVPFYQCTTDVQVLTTVLTNRQTPTAPRNVFIPPHVWHLLEQCWSFSPHKRPSIQHVVQRLKYPTRLIAVSEDMSICVWHSASGELIRRLTHRTSPLLDVCVSVSGALIGVAASDGSIAVYDSYSGSELLSSISTNAMVHAVAFSPDEMHIAEVSQSGALGIWHIPSRRKVHSLVQKTPGFAVQYSPDGTLIATGSWDGIARLFDCERVEEKHSLAGHQGWVSQVAFAPNGALLVTGGQDCTIRLWDIREGTQLQVLTGHSAEVRWVSFSPDATSIVSGANDRTCKTWQLASDNKYYEALTLSGHTNIVWSAMFSPDGTVIASASADRTVCLWDAKSGLVIRIFDATFTKGARGVAFAIC